MGWFTRLLRTVPREEREGIHLDTRDAHWEVDGPETFEDLFNALKDWIPEDSVLYFEDGSPDREISDFFAMHSISEVSHVAIGTIWPGPKVFHVPATKIVLTELARIMNRHAEPELAIHFHVYRNDSILIEWHDAFSQPMLIGGEISEEKVNAFAEKIGKSFGKNIEQVH